MFLCVSFQFRIQYPCQRIIKTVIISSISAKTKLLSIWAEWLLKAWTNHLWRYRVLHEFLFGIHCCFSLIISLVIIKSSRGYTWLKGFLSCLGFCFQEKADLNEIVIQSCKNELAATSRHFDCHLESSWPDELLAIVSKDWRPCSRPYFKDKSKSLSPGVFYDHISRAVNCEKSH